MTQDTMTVVVNREGGTASRLGDKLVPTIEEAFRKAGRAIDLKAVRGSEVQRVVAGAPGNVVAVGGGDGTIACAAQVLAEQKRCLAVLPLGTLNHFSQAIGLSGELDEAAQAAVHGQEQSVDVGRAGSTLFLNNASLGLYARMVEDRDRQRLPKWLATIPAALRVLWRPGARHLALSIDGAEQVVKTPLLFIGNNRYLLDAGAIGRRESLSEGVLSVYAVSEMPGRGLLIAALRILAGRANPRADFAAIEEAREVAVRGRGRHHIALDGEVVELAFPLKFTIEAKALRVMTPAAN